MMPSGAPDDGLVLGPNPPDKGHKRRRSFAIPTPDHSQLPQGMLHADHLPPDGPSNEFLQRPFDTNPQGTGGMLGGAAYGPVTAPHLDHFTGDFMGIMAGTNATNQRMNNAFVASQAGAQTHMNYHAARSVEAGMANFQALMDQGQSSSGVQAYNGLSYAQGSASFPPPNYSQAGLFNPTVNTPNQLHANPGGFAVPSFGPTGNNPFSSMSNAQRGFEQFGHSSVTLPFEETAHTSDHMRPAVHVPDTNWPNLSYRTTVSNANQSFYNPIGRGLADDIPLTPRSPCTPRGNHGINMVINDDMQEALQEKERLNSMEVPVTPPYYNTRSRSKLEYVAPQEPSSARGISHGSEGLDSQPDVEAGEKDSTGLKFDLNEVPTVGESTPKPRRKYHPRVAKDKRTYKPRKNGKKAPAEPVEETNTESHARKVSRRNQMPFGSTNEEGRDRSFPEHDTTVCDCEACIKLRLERRRYSPSEADIFNATPSPVTPQESHNRDYSYGHSLSLGGHAFGAQKSPAPASESPSVRRNLFSPLTSTPTASSHLQQFNQSAAQLRLLHQDHYNTTSEITRLQGMVDQHHRGNMMAMNRQNLLYSQFLSSYGAQPGAILPATNPAFQWTPSGSSSFHQGPARANNASIMSRLCPRGVLSPQTVPFRKMNNAQRVGYLKSILTSSLQQQIAPERLLQHVHEHLPEHEKADFKSLWGIILTPATDQQMQQRVDHAQIPAPAPPESTVLMPVQIYDPKPPRAKRGSKTKPELPTAMMLWPGLMNQRTRQGKPGKEKARKGVKLINRQLMQNSSGSVVLTAGTEMVPYGSKSVVPYAGPSKQRPKHKPRAKVVLDKETVRVWKRLTGKQSTEPDADADAEKEAMWEEERRKMKAHAQLFIERMHVVQGDRSFSCWKGSVVDSIVGAFLTQNVSDVLSSSAYMSMRSRFPGRGFRSNHQSPPHVPQSQERCSEGIHLATTSSPSELQTPQSHSGHKPTTSKTSKNSPSKADQSSHVVGTTEDANIHLEKMTSLESELVDGNQPSDGKHNSKTRLSGLERAKIEVKQVSARKSFDFSELQEEFKPRVEGHERMKGSARTEATEDGVDWEAVRKADMQVVADVIKERGMNWVLTGRIKAFLERVHLDYGALDLEWLKSMSTDQTKQFLLSIHGLGLKSVECIRLLTLHHLAFPVDTNVGRICVRLGWVPLEPLPEELQLHLLETYPMQATIQKYLWPRLCKLDQQTLYELHYQMITFGKVFCTKTKPNCNACPMRPECKHFASAVSSAKLALPAAETSKNSLPLALPSSSSSSPPPTSRPVSQYFMPVVEEPMTPESEAEIDDHIYDIEDFPFSIEEVGIQDLSHSYTQTASHVTHVTKVTLPEPVIGVGFEVEILMEDWRELATRVNVSKQGSCQDSGVKVVESGVDHESITIEPSVDVAVNASGPGMQEMVLVAPGAASIPLPKLKNVGRLRTVHYVYELPDNHPLLDGLDPREGDDPSTYLLAIWSPGEVPESIPNINDAVNENNTFASCSSHREESIKGTLLVPCRTAMQGNFPLNGTYFQTNEVFADHASSLQPILVPRTQLWNLRRRFVYFGTSVTSIFRGMTAEEVQACFWRGYVCVRGFDRSTREPQPLVGRLHLHAGKTTGKGTNMDD